MSQAVVAEIFIIGNEILIGDIQDTNTHWLCKEINSRGGYVARVTVLRDVADTIAEELRAALKRSPGVLFTSGGLGPTADDLTLASLARGAGLEYRLHPRALQMVRERYDELAAQGAVTQGGLNAAREKMAWLPEGSIPLHNPVGTAPGVLLQIGKTAVVSLPGVPSELKGIFGTSLQPFLKDTFNRAISQTRAITVRSNDESLMEPILSRVVKAHPKVYVKSLARTLGENTEIDIIFTAAGSESNEIEALLGPAMKDLQEGLTSINLEHRIKS